MHLTSPESVFSDAAGENKMAHSTKGSLSKHKVTKIF